jgi:tetratricopeptide (TPR) repeat protein
LRIKGFDFEKQAEFYPRIYERRFQGFPEEGFAYLEHVMTGKAKRRGEQGLEISRPEKVIEPGPGYSILAKILEKTLHRVVITTNFDNLVADALQVYTDKQPMVCGHETLASFVTVAMRRPVICKIHRDLFLAPLNDPRRLRMLHESWQGTLRTLLGHYTPIVIGYGGNDDSLMELLGSLERSEIKGRLVWCYFEGRDKQSQPSERICKLVEELNGVLVPVPDFDRLMILLGARLKIEVLDQALEERQNARTKRYRDAVLGLRTDDLPSLKVALKKTYQRAGWWWWQLRVDEEAEPEKREERYREAIEACPRSAELAGNFANFLKNVRKNHDEAERLYKHALELDPNNALNTGNYALFQTDVRKNHDEAERLYRRAMELDPNNATNTGNYANFLTFVRKGHDEAERLYRHALELDPNDANHSGNFAGFLLARGRTDAATPLVKRAFELNRGEANPLAGELHVYQTVIDVIQGRSCEAALAGLRKLLDTGFERGEWTFEPVFEAWKDKIEPEVLEVIRAYADAVLDESKVATLDERVREIRERHGALVAKKAAKRPRARKGARKK